jgi:hypothetical protein
MHGLSFVASVGVVGWLEMAAAIAYIYIATNFA